MAWFELMMFMIGECITTNTSDSILINGISVSPKKNFCILKIWNNTSNQRDKELLSKKLTFLNMDEVMYSAHSDNIQKDANKFKRREAYRNKRNQGRSYGNSRDGDGNSGGGYGNSRGGDGNSRGGYGNSRGGYGNSRGGYGNSRGGHGNSRGGHGKDRNNFNRF